MAYEVLYARQLHEQLMELPDSVYGKIEHSIGVLADNPGLSRDYVHPMRQLGLRWIANGASYPEHSKSSTS